MEKNRVSHTDFLTLRGALRSDVISRSIKSGEERRQEGGGKKTGRGDVSGGTLKSDVEG